MSIMLEETLEETKAMAFDPLEDDSYNYEEIIPSDEIPSGDGWQKQYSFTTPEGKQFTVWLNPTLKSKKLKDNYYKSTTPHYRGLVKIMKAVNPTYFNGAQAKSRCIQTVLAYGAEYDVVGKYLSVSRWIQENKFDDFKEYVHTYYKS
jgi:hypothetical protein